MRHLSGSQLALVLGMGVLLAAVLVLGAYAIHKILRRIRQETELKPKTPSPDDQVAFVTATMQGVIAGLKAQEKQLREWWEAAENRAEEYARINEVILREVPCGLIVFDREGFIKTANQGARTLLGIDIWARRRYHDVLGGESQLCACIRECLEDGKTYARTPVECSTPTGETRHLEISLSPLLARNRQIGGAVCLLSELMQTRQSLQ